MKRVRGLLLGSLLVVTGALGLAGFAFVTGSASGDDVPDSLPVADAIASDPSEGPQQNVVSVPKVEQARLVDLVLRSGWTAELFGPSLNPTVDLVVPRFDAADSLSGYGVHLLVARPQTIPAAGLPEKFGLPGRFYDASAVWIFVDERGSPEYASVDAGTLDPTVKLPIVDPDGLNE